MEAELSSLSSQFGVDPNLIQEYHNLFKEAHVPMDALTNPNWQTQVRATNVLMVSTHGYWDDPPPAGVPDTGGQTYYVLKIAKALATQGRKVLILVRWFSEYPERVQRVAEDCWIVRLRAGSDAFVRKEEIYPLTPHLSEAAVAVGALFGAEASSGHYADGMTVAAEVAERLRLPLFNTAHSMGVWKRSVRFGEDPRKKTPEEWLREAYTFYTREVLEVAALQAANLQISTTPLQDEVLREHYHIHVPSVVMPAGASEPFFEAGEAPYEECVATIRPLLDKHGLAPGQYIIFWGRMATAKTIERVAQVLGEARKVAPECMGMVKVLIIGGNAASPSAEERQVNSAIAAEVARYGLEGDCVRLPNTPHSIIAPLGRCALAYVGMQEYEPFGMGPAEAMAARCPVVISAHAGITSFLEHDKDALVVDPASPPQAAEALVRLISDDDFREELAERGFQVAKSRFSWDGIAAQMGEMLDRLRAHQDPRTVVLPADKLEPVPLDHFTRREGRAHWRVAPAWRGDLPCIKGYQVEAAEELLPLILARAQEAADRNERLTVALGGESGSGKTEIATVLQLLLHQQRLRGLCLPGDGFFKRPPAANHAHRLACHAVGRLKDAVGPHEVDMERLDAVLAQATDRRCAKVDVPSESRAIPGRHYDRVPVSLDGVDVVLVDLTYSLLLESAACKIFLARSSLAQLDIVRERNIARDPTQDFEFIRAVLRLEHHLIAPLQQHADIVVDADYHVVTP